MMYKNEKLVLGSKANEIRGDVSEINLLYFMIQRIYKDPVKRYFIFLLFVVGCLSYFEYKWGVDKEIIIISVSVVGIAIGYFVTHFLEDEGKKRQEKIKLYMELISRLRIFMGRGGKTNDEAKKDVRKFEDTYYRAWLYISTSVYEKLIAYMEQYQVWVADSSDKNKIAVNEKLLLLMRAIRDEVTVDKKAKFKNYILLDK